MSKNFLEIENSGTGVYFTKLSIKPSMNYHSTVSATIVQQNQFQKRLNSRVYALYKSINVFCESTKLDILYFQVSDWIKKSEKLNHVSKVRND